MKHLVVLISIMAFALNVKSAGNYLYEKEQALGSVPEIVQKYSHHLDEFEGFSLIGNSLNSGNSGFMEQKMEFQEINLKSGFVSEKYKEFLEKPKINLDLGSRNKRRRYGVEKDYSWELLGIFASSILLDAVGDGLNDRGDKVWGHGLQAASTGVLLASPFIIDIDLSKWGYYLASYVTMRIALFDFAYNATRGLPLDYVGNSSLWDKGLQEFRPPLGGQVWGRGVSLGFSLGFIFCEF